MTGGYVELIYNTAKLLEKNFKATLGKGFKLTRIPIYIGKHTQRQKI